MTTTKSLLFSLCMLFVGIESVSAQYAMDQARSLTGVETVTPIFANDLAASADLVDAVTLELRKTGLRIVADSADIILNLSIAAATQNTISYDVTTRLDVEQNVTIDRTGESLQLVTWYYEDNERINSVDWTVNRVRAELIDGVNRFLNDYLTANGR